MPPPREARSSRHLAQIYVGQLEGLIDELIKEKPIESQIRDRMTAAGLNYTSDPVVRMGLVLKAMIDLQSGKPKQEDIGL